MWKESIPFFLVGLKNLLVCANFGVKKRYQLNTAIGLSSAHIANTTKGNYPVHTQRGTKFADSCWQRKLLHKKKQNFYLPAWKMIIWYVQEEIGLSYIHMEVSAVEEREGKLFKEQRNTQGLYSSGVTEPSVRMY